MGRIFSGIQPSGEITIGNYCGAIRNWADLLDEYESIFSIVDQHAITVLYEPKEMQDRILAAASVNIAAGLDPEKCTLFTQSDVPEHTELSWYFMTVTPMGDLGRMTQFKEKAKRHRENVNVGLFGYPVLQVADILVYKADTVPVGEDQVQHIELARDVARKWNARFGDVFPEPQAKLSPTPRIMGLDGKTKMSKSMDNYISLVEEPDSIRAKLSRAMTDENRKRRNDPGNPDICNIFTLLKHLIFFHKTDLFQYGRDRIRGLRPLVKPVGHSFLEDPDRGRFLDRVIKTQGLNKSSVAGHSGICRNKSVRRSFLSTQAF